jgi:hypothetical protein
MFGAKFAMIFQEKIGGKDENRQIRIKAIEKIEDPVILKGIETRLIHMM